MFENIGGKIKGLVKFIVVVCIIISVIDGLSIYVAGISSGDEYVAAIAFCEGLIRAGVGCLLAWIGSFVIYGFGVIVERIDHLKPQYFSQKGYHDYSTNEPPIEKKSEVSDQIAVVINENGTWECPFCDHINTAKSTKCAHCGVLIHFVQE